LNFDNENIILTNPIDKSVKIVSRMDNIRDISFTELPEGLITKPTLIWQIYNERPGSHLTELSYLTKGINWLCDYVAVVDKDDRNIDLSSWVTLDNKSGATYRDVRLKLIAANVHRVKEMPFPKAEKKIMMEGKAAVGIPQFEQKTFFEYHMYMLQNKTTLKDNQTKQITLLASNNIPIKKLFIYDPYKDYSRYYYHNEKNTKEQKVKVKIEIANTKENNLGIPLPKGKVRVYKRDADGTLEFIGEDIIDHTSKDEKIRLFLGDTFDVVGKRMQTNYRQPSNNSIEETYEISLRNHKEEDIEVIAVEHLWRHSNWKIIATTHDFEKKDAQTIEFKVPVLKDSETKITYTVRYWWK
jgi:hypothetical protein